MSASRLLISDTGLREDGLAYSFARNAKRWMRATVLARIVGTLRNASWCAPSKATC